MNRIVGLGVLLALVVGAGWLVQSGAEERGVRRVVDDVRQAALVGLNPGPRTPT